MQGRNSDGPNLTWVWVMLGLILLFAVLKHGLGQP